MLRGKLRVGLVGCGYWGPKHLRVMMSDPQVEEVVAIDLSAERLRRMSAGIGGLRCFTSLRTALPEVDAVIIATPPSTHVRLALQAIAAGKSVLVEKPLATSAEGCRVLIEAAAAAGVVLMVGHTFEYNPAVLKLRDVIADGELGRLHYLDTARLNLGLYQNDVNVVFDLAPHDISIINCLLGRRPTQVQAWGARHAHRQFEDVAYLRLAYGEGGDETLSANVHVSWLDPCKVRRVTAVGSRKMAVYNDLASDDRIRIFDKGVVGIAPSSDETQVPMSYRYGDITSPFVEPHEPLALQDSHFVACVVDGSVPRTDGQSGLDVVAVLEAAQVSMLARQPVLVDDVLSGATDGEVPAGGAVLRLPGAATPRPRTERTQPASLLAAGLPD